MEKALKTSITKTSIMLLIVLMLGLFATIGYATDAEKQKRLMVNEGFLGRVEVLLAKYATALTNPPAATTCNTTNGSKVITNIPSTAGMVIGHVVEIALVPNSPATIKSVDSATQITV